MDSLHALATIHQSRITIHNPSETPRPWPRTSNQRTQSPFDKTHPAVLPSAPLMQTLPGFRDFYPEDCARRNYILATWRAVARRYGFVEYDGPVLEPMALYEKKSGGELVGQLFDFVDK